MYVCVIGWTDEGMQCFRDECLDLFLDGWMWAGGLVDR